MTTATRDIGSMNPNYRYEGRIVDTTTGETIISDWCSLTESDMHGGSEIIDMTVASMLRTFERTARGEYERNIQLEPT